MSIRKQFVCDLCRQDTSEALIFGFMRESRGGFSTDTSRLKIFQRMDSAKDEAHIHICTGCAGVIHRTVQAHQSGL